MRSLAGIIVVVLIAGAAVGFEPEEHLPADTLALVDFSLEEDFEAKVQGTALWKLYQDPEVQRFLERPIEKARKTFEEWKRVVEEDTGLEVGPLLGLLPPRRLAVALPSFDFDEEPAALVLLADFGPKAGEARKVLEKVIEVAGKRANENEAELAISEREVGGIEVRRLVATWKERVGRNGEMTEEHFVSEVAFVKSALLLTAGDDPEAEAIALDGYLAPEESLGEEEDFAAVRETMGEGVPFAYLRLDTLLEEMARAAREEAEKREEDESGETPIDVDALMKAIGVRGARSAAYVQKIDGADLVDLLHVRIPGPREGLVAALSSAPLPEERLAHLAPGASHVYTEQSLDLEKLWKSIEKIVEVAAGEEGEKEFRKGLASLEEKIGASLSEVLASFSGRMASYMVMPQNLASLGEQGVILPLEDVETLREAIAKVREIPEVKEVLFFKEETHQDVEIVSITFRNLPLPVMPSYAFLEGHLVITENPRSLRRLIDTLRSPGESSAGAGAAAGALVEVEAFQAIQKRAFPEGAFLGSYYDLGNLIERLYGSVASMVPMVLADPDARTELAEYGFDLSLLPSAKAVARPFTNGWENATVDAGGLTYRGRSGFGAGVAGVYKTIFAAAVPFGVVVGMQKHVLDRQEDVSRKRLEKIHDAVEVYSRTIGAGRQPRDLLALVSAGLIEKENLVAPADRDPKTVEDPGTGEEIPVSYRLRAEGFQEENGLVLYEREAWYGEGRRLVVYKNGRIKTTRSEDRFERLLRGQED